MEEIAKAYERVSGFSADVETRHETSSEDVTATRSLIVSKLYGWRIIEGVGKLRREIINDFRTNFVYYPEQKRALRLVARSPEVAAEFRKPVTDTNPVFALARESLKFLGSETLDRETVYHFEGTTTTQFLQAGKPVKIRIEAWVSPKDGLPRKTVERWEDRTGTTVFRNVTLRDDLTTDQFQFVPPKDVEVIDIGGE